MLGGTLRVVDARLVRWYVLSTTAVSMDLDEEVRLAGS
jgi:hypothetical protein